MGNDRKDYTAMTEKELRRLSRMDLLEMLLEQSREVERLQKELETVKNQLSDRRIMEQEAGSIAEASLKLNKVFEAAQQAADQYQKEIEKEFGLWPSTATEVLKNLEKDGLICRVPEAQDGRYKKIVFTEKAEAIRETLREEIKNTQE